MSAHVRLGFTAPEDKGMFDEAPNVIIVPHASASPKKKGGKGNRRLPRTFVRNKRCECWLNHLAALLAVALEPNLIEVMDELVNIDPEDVVLKSFAVLMTAFHDCRNGESSNAIEKANDDARDVFYDHLQASIGFRSGSFQTQMVSIDTVSSRFCSDTRRTGVGGEAIPS